MAINIVKHIGRKGATGQDGTNGLGASSISGGEFSRPFSEIFKPSKLHKGVRWSRDSQGAFQNSYDQQQVIAAPTSEQIVQYTNDIDTASDGWFDEDLNWSRTATGVTDPFGSNNAQEITITDTTSDNNVFVNFNSAVEVGSNYHVSFWLQVVSGTIDRITAGISSAGTTLGDSDFDISGIGASWVRLDTVVTATFAGNLTVYFETTGCVVNMFQVNATKGIGLFREIFTADNPPVVFNTYSQIYRESDRGYLIEPASTNLCEYGEDFRRWAVNGATVGLNAEFDSFADGGSYTLLTINGSTTATLSQLELTEGQTYSVSFIAKREVGDVDNIAVSLGSEFVTATTTEGYTRQSYQVVASGDGIMTFTVAAGQSASIVLAGIQIETGDATGYIPTKGAAANRSFDSVIGELYLLPSLLRPFTVYTSFSRVFQNDSDKFIFSCGGSFSLRLNGSDLIARGGNADLVTATLNDPTNAKVAVVFNGTNMRVYVNGAFVSESAYNGETLKPSFFYIGSSDANGASVLGGYIKRLDFYNYAASDDDIKYISGV